MLSHKKKFVREFFILEQKNKKINKKEEEE